MKNATQQFLKYRPNAEYIEKVEHRPNSNYQRRECITMSVVEAKNFGTKFITGWLVDNYNESINATPIIHHCWNIDKGVHYDTIPKKETKYDYVMDPDVNKPYSYQGIYYISPVIYLTDTELKIIVRDGRKATITEEEHKRFYNERQQEAVLQKMDKIRKE